MKKICIMTATRAEYGLLKPIIKKLQEIGIFDVRVAVTGAHLSVKLGLTYKQIEQDGIHIDKKIHILSNSDTSKSISKAMASTISQFADYFDDIAPDLLIVLGDRYEALAVCIAAMNAHIPIAHLHGGEVTQGATDEAMRHSITKMSHLHFTATEEYMRRVVQLGEHPNTVFYVGSTGCETIQDLNLMDKDQLEQEIGFSFGKRTAMLTFHPVTLEKDSSQAQFSNLLDALDAFPSLKVIITKANADAGGSIINRMIDNYASKHPDKAKAYASLGQLRYYSALQYCDVVIGNSSSGIIEAPSFHVPTVDIGDRQKGRTAAVSLIHCTPDKKDIIKALNTAFSEDFKRVAQHSSNPYSKSGSASEIVSIIQEFLSGDKLKLKKKFYDIGAF